MLLQGGGKKQSKTNHSTLGFSFFFALPAPSLSSLLECASEFLAACCCWLCL